MATQIHAIVSMPFAENTYILWLDGQTDALVVDPGLDPEAILDFLGQQGLTAAAILNTHGHADHIAGNEALKQAYPAAPLVIGVNETALLADANLNLSAMFGLPLTSPPADRTVAAGEKIAYAGIDFEVREIPGHSPGHVVYIRHAQSGEPTVVIGGDVLFRAGVGRTDFPGGSFDLLAAGIRRDLFTLPDKAIVYPGHGPSTTVGREKRTNPFVGEA
jgi:glyoxylase-like metal-dependent hydrolase (beta-lactamase superfamily II)